MSSSPHLAQIPEAVRIAASVDPSLDPALKEQALSYLSKVKELCESTWQDCLSLYLQGAGAAESSSAGKDGKQKLDQQLRIYCEQVVDTVLISKAEVIGPEAQLAMYNALMEFVQTEWVNGSCEQGQSFFRNKLACTLAYLFLAAYPSPVPQFLHPFINFLSPSDPSSSSNPHPRLLAIRLLSEIALEVHDIAIRSARPHSEARIKHDGQIRDTIRSSGDEKLAVNALLAVAEHGLDIIECGQDQQRWAETTELALKTLAAWTPWVDISVSITPSSLQFFRRTLQTSINPVRISSANIFRTLAAKGMQNPQDKLQVLKVLDVLAIVDPLESTTRAANDEETAAFRAALGAILSAYESDLLDLVEDPEVPDAVRGEAESMMKAGMPIVLRFLSDRQHDVPLSVSPFISEYLRINKKTYVPKNPPQPPKGTMAPPPPPVPQLPQDKRDFLASVLDILIRQLAWPDDAEWETPDCEADPDDELANFRLLRTTCRSHIESIAAIDRTLHTEIVANIAFSTLEQIRTNGPSAVKWQNAELALHLVFSFGELTKTNTRAAFYDLPPDVAAKSARPSRKLSFTNAADAMSVSSGSSTPTHANGSAVDVSSINGGHFGERIDYTQYPLTPLGQLLALCMTSGVATFPHPSVTTQYFEIAVRYVEFWKSKPETLAPMLEAMLDARGIHHPIEGVRKRCFYLLSKFIRECRRDLILELVEPILQGMQDLLIVKAELPEPTDTDEDLLQKATASKSYFSDQCYLFETAGHLVAICREDPVKQIPLLEAIAGSLMNGLTTSVQTYGASPQDKQAVLSVHHHLMALGHFAKGFPMTMASNPTPQPYQEPFKQMTQVLLQALRAMKTERIVRDSARFSFSQFVSAIGQSVAELVPQFVSEVATEFEPSELVDFMIFLNLLMHRLKDKAFETMDMLLLPLLSRIFAVLSKPATGTDEVVIHRRLSETFISFSNSLMNANLDGVFITERNKPEFENVLQALLSMTSDFSDQQTQRLAFAFFAKSVIAWGTSEEAAAAPSVFAESALSQLSRSVANGQQAATNQHAIPKTQRASQALPGYQTFIYGRLLPACFEVPANEKFVAKSGQPLLHDIAMLLRNTLQARGQEAIDFLLNDLLPKLQCPPHIATQLIDNLRTQQAKDFRRTFADFIKAMKS